MKRQKRFEQSLKSKRGSLDITGTADVAAEVKGMNWYTLYKLSMPLRRSGSGPLWHFLTMPSTRQAIAQIVQKEYDEWQQDEHGYDEEVGGGGICNLVAEAISDYLMRNKIECKTYGAEEDHTAVVAATRDECYHVDVHWTHYEQCNGMYCYTKIQDVQITPDMVEIAPQHREVLLDEETGEWPEGWGPHPEEDENL